MDRRRRPRNHPRIAASAGALVLAMALLISITPGATAASAGAWRFEPRPISTGDFSKVNPTSGTRVAATTPNALGGVDQLYYEAWLPGRAADGSVPPARVPTILTVTPYVTAGVEDGDNTPLVHAAVRAGYAYVQAHIRGTGSSQGCIGDFSPTDVADVIEAIAREPWSDRTVGLYGISHRAMVAVAALTQAPKERLGALKAAVVAGAQTNEYEFTVGMDGVPAFMMGTEAAGWGHNPTRGFTTDRPETAQPERRAGCAVHLPGHASPDGSVTKRLAALDYRPGAATVDVPVLLAHGLGDTTVYPIQPIGFFEQLPRSARKAAVIGNFEHEWPDGHDWAAARDGVEEHHWETQASWTRTDWVATALAWFDRYVRGLDTGVEGWPTVQVQSNDGTWRAEPDWPWTGGRAGWLALGPGVLGTRHPEGASTYREGTYRNTELAAAGSTWTQHGPASVRFDSGPLPGPLSIVGQPVLDLWVSLDRDDAHLTASLEALDADGRPLGDALDVSDGRYPFHRAWANSTFGARSLQHVDPLKGNRFVQAEARPVEVTLPPAQPRVVHTTLRFQPRDWIVPEGGRLVVTVTGSVPWRVDGRTAGFHHPFQVSGKATAVTIHHDCTKPSALRFLLQDAVPKRLVVDTVEGPSPAPAAAADPTAAGLATSPVCGRSPETDRPTSLGPRRPGGSR